MCGWKDRCRDGNLRTYCHVSPFLFGCFFLWKPALHVFCIFVKCFFGIIDSCYCYWKLHAPAVVLDPKCSTREPVNYGEQSSPIGVDAADKEVVGKDEVGVITCIYKRIPIPS